MFFYLTIIVLVLLYYILTRKYNYFKNKKIPHLKPKFLVGNYGDYFFRKKTMLLVVQEICKQFPDEKFVGAYYGTETVLIPIDPDIIKLIMTKEFHYFNGRNLTEHNHREPVTRNLFATYGDNWKVLRQNMTPLFSTAKIKNMFHLIEKCSYTFEDILDKEISISKELQVQKLTAKFTIECIAACGFGIDANTMTEENAFSKLALSVETFSSNTFYKILLRSTWPNIFYALGFTLLEPQLKFLDNMITSVLNARNFKASGRNDFVDLILSWQQKKEIVGDGIKRLKTGEKHKVTLPADNDLLVAQCFIIFTAGYVTSSATISYTLYELAKHQKIQNKVLEEIDGYLSRRENKLLYECVNELPYLEAVIDETLRLYPILGIITREQMEDYTFPNGIQTDKKMRIQIPVYYLHHNPNYYPDPEEFRPERFLGEAKKKINPYTYMPFGEGPRICIGMRFAKMQMMAAFTTILKKYRLELADDTPRKLKFQPESLAPRPVGGIKLKFIERDGWRSRVFVQD